MIYAALIEPIEFDPPISSSREFIQQLSDRHRPICRNATEKQKKVLETMWDFIPRDRINFDQVIEHFENGDLIFSGTDTNEFMNYKNQIKALNTQYFAPRLATNYSNDSDESFLDSKKSVFDNNVKKISQPLDQNLIQAKNIVLIAKDNQNDDQIYNQNNDHIHSDNNNIMQLSMEKSILEIDFKQYQVLEKYDKDQYSKAYGIFNFRTGMKHLAKYTVIKEKNFIRERILFFSREVYILSKINHPSFLKFIGYKLTNFAEKRKPTIVLEYPQKGRLSNFFDTTNQIFLDDTDKLITLYGIAYGMSYLHKHNIIHRYLSTNSIYFDDLLHPKISDLTFSIELSTNEEIINDQKLLGNVEYSAPEILMSLKYSKASDVYAFAIIAYKIIVNEKAFKFESINEFVENVGKKSFRPEFKNGIPSCYQKIIEKCWAQNFNERPTFEEIVNELKTNEEFLSNKIDIEKYQKYIKYTEDYLISFESNIKIKPIDDLLQSYCHKLCKLELLRKFKKYDDIDPHLDLDNYQIESNRDAYNKVINNIFFDNTSNNIIVDKETDLRFSSFVYPPISTFCRYEMINFARFISIFSQLNHPSILKYVGYSPVDFDNKPNVMVFTKVTKKTIDFDLNYNDTQKLIIIYGIAHGMCYLHSHNILHRNLNPSVIYVDKNNFPIISGFDIAKEIKGDAEEYNEKIKGTPAYIAPEVYLHKGYSKMSDVYSYSLIMYELLTGHQPYDNIMNTYEMKTEITSKGHRPPITNIINEGYRTLIERCWSSDPENRPSFIEIVKELRTNPTIISNTIDKEDFFEYVTFLDNCSSNLNSDKRIDFYDDILKTKLHTFADIYPDIFLQDIYSIEKGNLRIDSAFISKKKYEKIENLTDGNFYEIKKYKEKKSNIICAMRKTKKGLWNLYQNEIINFSRELNILLQLNHPSIIKFYGYSSSKLNIFDGYHPIIITEFSSKGSLGSIFESKRLNDLNEEEINDTQKLIILYGIAKGMSYLHLHNIIHRDLQPFNIYLDDYLHPKISGFNIAKEIKGDAEEYNEKIKGTPAYIAPEVYLHKGYSKMSDVYSYSLIMYELLTGHQPYDNIMNAYEMKSEITSKGHRPPITNIINEGYRTLIERCWSSDPENRPSFIEIVKELRTNPTIISNTIDKENFFKYVEFIDKYPVSFNTSKRTHFEEFIKHEISRFSPNKYKINLRSIYQTETNDVFFDLKSVDIKQFKKQKLVQKDKFFKLYTVVDQTTNSFYIAKRIYNNSQNTGEVPEKRVFYEINEIYKINNPLILKIIGFSPFDFKNNQLPIVIYENAENGPLNQIFEIERLNESTQIFDETKKLISIYGIASGMSYLHSHNIIHCALNPSNIFLDEFLFPKITGLNDFLYLSENPILDVSNKKCDSFFYLFNIDTTYVSPETYCFNVYSSASNAFSFGFIAYLIVTGIDIYDVENKNEIIKKICLDDYRPKFKDSIPKHYKKLIKKCWSKDQKERPTFDEIVYHLKTNPDFITDNLNKDEFLNYVQFIDKTLQSPKDQNLRIDDFILSQNKEFRRVKVDFNKLKDWKRQQFSVDIGTLNINDYQKVSKIGSGSFGNVYTVINKNTQEIFAAKISIHEIDQCTDDVIVNITREISIIANLNHPSIFKFIGYSPINFNNKPKPVIITEFAPNGSLDKMLELERKGLAPSNWNDTKKLINIYGIASAMNYLHNINILHRDLKPANILLDANLYPKIADFGLSKKLNETGSKNSIPSGFKGTYSYCSPEIIQNKEYTEKGDIYAFAMIVYEIITGEELYPGKNVFQLLIEISKGNRPKINRAVPYCYRKLIEKCWKNNSKERPYFGNILFLIENDNRFITENINIEEFEDYVSFIKESKEKELFEVIETNNNQTIHSINQEKEEEINSEFFLDLTKFDRESLISKSDTYKNYNVREKSTGFICTAQISMKKINNYNQDEKDRLIQEIKIISQINHPSLMKFIGFSPRNFKNKKKPVIIMENLYNGTLAEILEIEQNGKNIPEWNDTKKFINIYGIASAMLYLHSNNIIHRSLNPSNVYLDDALLPKIGYFGLIERFIQPDTFTHSSISGIKSAPIYFSPEIIQFNEYSKKGDVYAFSFIVYEILMNKKPFCEFENINDIFRKVVNENYRPEIGKNIPICYKDLINRCWSIDPNERPSFEDIISILKNDSEFITDKINKEDFQKYAKFMDSKIIHIENQKIEEN